MTPLAARLYRTVDAGLVNVLPGIKDVLVQHQFFECSAVYPLAAEMLNQDVAAGADVYSENAHLPAPLTALEYLYTETASPYRILVLCQQIDLEIRWWQFLSTVQGPALFASGGFVLGQKETLESALFKHPGRAAADYDYIQDNFVQWANTVNGLIEKTALIINQPNLIDRVRRPMDKRISRDISRSGAIGPFDYWSECKIRGGVHYKAGSRGDGETERPLHYVRKYFKPTSGVWVDGYWRGNADIGIHLKVYSPQVPAEGMGSWR